MRAVRGFVDGLVSVLLARYLTRLGFTPLEVGAIVTGTLFGSAALTMGLGLAAHRWHARTILVAAVAAATHRWPLLVVAVVGTLNPSAGDVSIFLPTEQTVLARETAGHQRTVVFAWYNVAGTRAGGIGAEIAAVLSERCFEYLDGPLVRVTAPDTPVPFAPTLEEFFLPNAEKVCKAARALVAY